MDAMCGSAKTPETEITSEIMQHAHDVATISLKTKTNVIKKITLIVPDMPDPGCPDKQPEPFGIHDLLSDIANNLDDIQTYVNTL